MLAAASSSSVDLPMPGSPASSTTAPGTRPPPSTRSSSLTPVVRAAAISALTWPIGSAGAVVAPACTTLNPARAPSSSTVPPAWHSPHRPTHLVVRQPHSAQRYPGFWAVLAMLRRLAPLADKSGKGSDVVRERRQQQPLGLGAHDLLHRLAAPGGDAGRGAPRAV